MTTELEVEDKPTVDVDGESERRIRTWHGALHESAHLVAARVLLKKSGTAMVFGEGGGVAEVGGGVPASFKEAMVAAAGIFGDVLALSYPPPEGLSPTPAEVAAPQTAQRLKAAYGRVMSDRMAVAQWCIADRECEPDTWAARHAWVFSSAEEFVQEHRQEVVAVATELFSRGVITLPAQPEEGAEHVG
jgi:hypothetical protein